jgi:putative redox protein
MELTAHWEGGYRVRVRVRDFDVVSDEPPDDGGQDSGPTPTELLLASLASCFTMAVYHAARKRQIELEDLSVRVSADYDGLRLSRFVVSVHSSHPRHEIESFKEQATRWCYVSNTLRGMPDIDYVVASGPLTAPQAPPPRA